MRKYNQVGGWLAGRSERELLLAKGASLMLIKRFWQPQITALVCKLAFRTLTRSQPGRYKTERSPTLKTTDCCRSNCAQIKINHCVSRWRDKSAFILFRPLALVSSSLGFNVNL